MLTFCQCSVIREGIKADFTLASSLATFSSSRSYMLHNLSPTPTLLRLGIILYVYFFLIKEIFINTRRV